MSERPPGRCESVGVSVGKDVAENRCEIVMQRCGCPHSLVVLVVALAAEHQPEEGRASEREPDVANAEFGDLLARGRGLPVGSQGHHEVLQASDCER
ncbi:MAG: hypothetical protein BWY94_02390 [Actinobacteria bacterium ADurb.BinA094]|nr:MAG: hypothetical protein BWY94_02390 [Actinobacteria bacterium ADurb.BinA094]